MDDVVVNSILNVPISFLINLRLMYGVRVCLSDLCHDALLPYQQSENVNINIHSPGGLPKALGL